MIFNSIDAIKFDNHFLFVPWNQKYPTNLILDWLAEEAVRADEDRLVRMAHSLSMLIEDGYDFARHEGIIGVTEGMRLHAHKVCMKIIGVYGDKH